MASIGWACSLISFAMPEDVTIAHLSKKPIEVKATEQSDEDIDATTGETHIYETKSQPNPANPDAKWVDENVFITSTPAPRDPPNDPKIQGNGNATIVYVYLDENSRVVAVEVSNESKNIQPGDSYEKLDASTNDGQSD